MWPEGLQVLDGWGIGGFRPDGVGYQAIHAPLHVAQPATRQQEFEHLQALLTLGSAEQALPDSSVGDAELLGRTERTLLIEAGVLLAYVSGAVDGGAYAKFAQIDPPPGGGAYDFVRSHGQEPLQLMRAMVELSLYYTDTVRQASAVRILEQVVMAGALSDDQRAAYQHALGEIRAASDPRQQNEIRQKLCDQVVAHAARIRADSPSKFTQDQGERLDTMLHFYRAWDQDQSMQSSRDILAHFNKLPALMHQDLVNQWSSTPTWRQAKKRGFANAFRELQQSLGEQGAGLLGMAYSLTSERFQTEADAADALRSALLHERDIVAYMGDTEGVPRLKQRVLHFIKYISELERVLDKPENKVRAGHRDIDRGRLRQIRNRLVQPETVALREADAVADRETTMDLVGRATGKNLGVQSSGEPRSVAEVQDRAERGDVLPRLPERATLRDRLDMIRIIEHIFEAQLVCESDIKENFDPNSSRQPYFLLVFKRIATNGQEVEFSVLEHLEEKWATYLYGSPADQPGEAYTELYKKGQRQDFRVLDAITARHVPETTLEHHVRRVIQRLQEVRPATPNRNVGYGLTQADADAALARLPEALQLVARAS